MKPRRFPAANKVFRLDGGTEDNDLWVEQGEFNDGTQFVRSVWTLTSAERYRIADGQNITLTVIGPGTPPVMIAVTPEQPGKSE